MKNKDAFMYSTKKKQEWNDNEKDLERTRKKVEQGCLRKQKVSQRVRKS
jgi:hypothetical protein